MIARLAHIVQAGESRSAGRLIRLTVEEYVGQNAIGRVHRYAIVRDPIDAAHSHRVQRFRQQLRRGTALQFIFG